MYITNSDVKNYRIDNPLYEINKESNKNTNTNGKGDKWKLKLW